MSSSNSNTTTKQNPSTGVKGGGEIDLEDGTGGVATTGGLVDAAARVIPDATDFGPDFKAQAQARSVQPPAAAAAHRSGKPKPKPAAALKQEEEDSAIRHQKPEPPLFSPHWPASNRTANNDPLPDFKDQVRLVQQPPRVQGSIKHKQDPAVAAKVGNRLPPAPIDGGPAFKDQVRQQQQRHSVDPLQQEGIRNGPRFKDQCANAQNVPTDRQSSPDQDPAEAGPPPGIH